MQNIPLFGVSASLISPPSPTVTSGYFPLQYLPAENLNYYLNGATQAIQEWVNLITLAGLTPGTSQQGWAAISGLIAIRPLSFFTGLTAAATGTGQLVLATAPTLVAPLANTINGLAITTTVSGVLSIASGKTFTEKSTLTLQGTDGNVIDSDAIIRSVYQGLLLTWVSTTSFSVGIGCTGDSTFVSTMLLAASTTKTTSAWAVGSGNGGLDTGAIAASTMYYIYLIKRPDTQVVDVLFSTSASAPTMPTNYTLKRLIGATLTDGSSHFTPFIGYQDGTQMWTTLTQDVNDATLTTARKTYTVATLPNVKCSVSLNVSLANAATVVADIYGDNNLTDSATASAGPVVGKSKSEVGAVASVNNISGMVFNGNSLYARASAASTTIQVSIVSFNVRPYN